MVVWSLVVAISRLFGVVDLFAGCWRGLPLWVLVWLAWCLWLGFWWGCLFFRFWVVDLVVCCLYLVGFSVAW